MEQNTVTLGALTLRVGRLTLGQLRHSDTLSGAVEMLTKDGAAAMQAGRLPSRAYLDAMTEIAFCAAAATPDLTRDAFDAAVDSLPFDIGLPIVAKLVGAALHGRAIEGLPSGEAASP